MPVVRPVYNFVMETLVKSGSPTVTGRSESIIFKYSNRWCWFSGHLLPLQ